MPSEIEGAGLTPERPTSPKIAPSTLEEYFDSIKEPFQETQQGLATESPIGWFVAVFISCLIPLLPYGASKLAFWIFGAKVVAIRGAHFHIESLWFWWILLFAVSLLLLVIVAKFSGVSTDEKKKWLSPPQMRFAYCYAAVREIRQYKTNQRPWHIKAALNFFDKTAKSLFRTALVGITPEYSYLEHGELVGARYPLVALVGNAFPSWYRLRPETETILRAFREFVPKLRDRLKDKKDLGSIEAALNDLAAYQYSEIPELSDSKSETRFEEGTEILLGFAQQISSLPPYRSESLNPTPKETFSRRVLFAGRHLSRPFTHSNVLVAFCTWLFLMLALFWGGFYIALRLFPIKMDSTIMTALIGGPVATAVTGATIPRLGKIKKREG